VFVKCCGSSMGQEQDQEFIPGAQYYPRSPEVHSLHDYFYSLYGLLFSTVLLSSEFNFLAFVVRLLDHNHKETCTATLTDFSKIIL